MRQRLPVPAVHSMPILEQLLDHVRTTRPPVICDLRWLHSWSTLNDNNDSEVLLVLKLLGFTDANGAPTNRWIGYQKDSIATMATAVRETYAAVLNAPASKRAPSESPTHAWFRHSISSRTTRERAIRTFQRLCSLAEIDDQLSSDKPADNGARRMVTDSPIVFMLPANCSREVYVEIFEAALEAGLATRLPSRRHRKRRITRDIPSVDDSSAA